MTGKKIDVEGLMAVRDRLGDAVIDPALWPQIMEQISSAAGATGAFLLQSDIRTPDVPRSEGVRDLIDYYFAEGWHIRDARAPRGIPLLLSGERVVTDEDIGTADGVRQLDFYKECLAPFGFQYFAAIGFWSGSALWAMAIQRTFEEGPFDQDERVALAELSQHLTETATLSKAVGRAALAGISNGLDLVPHAALAFDRQGFVLQTNTAAERLFDEEVRVANRRLVVRDDAARAALDGVIARLNLAPHNAAIVTPPIVVRRRTKRPLIMRLMPVDGVARDPFLGARALLVFTDMSQQVRPPLDLLAQAFGLSPSEARLAAIMATGISTEHAAEELGISRATARNQLKAIFAKTATHRQGELIALLQRM
jgi:DNA-binding CsgD family transcriptional regulator